MNYVLYHANCPDGFMAAYICWAKLGDSAEYIPCSYDKDETDKLLDNSHVYTVDFSFSKEITEKLVKRMTHIVVLDHHKTAKDNLESLINVYPNLYINFDMTKCGAILTWEYWNDEPVPLIYKYVQDRDLWLWNLPESRAVSAYLSLQKKDFNHYHDVVMNTDNEEMITTGKIILETYNQLVNSVIKNAFIEKIDGYYVPVIYCPILQSEIGEALINKYPNHPFVAIASIKDKSIQWSLRSRDDFDVSVIAKKFGGGGHKNAAGFYKINK